MFLKQMIGKYSAKVWVGVLVLIVLAVLVKGMAVASTLVLVGLFLALFVLTLSRLEWGVYIAFAEIFVGGHGHLIQGDLFGFPLSLRLVIFLAVLSAWLVLLLQKKISFSFFAFRDAPWLVIILAVFLGVAIGFLQNNPASVFDDANGYATILYLFPILSVAWNVKRKRELLQVLFASAFFTASGTLLLSYLFTHLDGETLHWVYRFVRDQRLAEVTLQTVSSPEGEIVRPWMASLLGPEGYWYRIFFPSHFFVLIAGLLTVSASLNVWRGERVPEYVWLFIALFVSALVLSMSRSFAVGALAGFASVWGASFFVGKRATQTVLRRSFLLVLAGAAGVGLALGTILLPFPEQPDIRDASFYATSADTGREVAVSSRWELLGPLMDRIWSAPLVGSGFGAEVTYTSDDPRIRAQQENGEYTTYRFEWGYQDIWLKMGLFGLIGFAWYGAMFLQGAVMTLRRHGHKWILIGMIGGMAALFFTHTFSPYLNHPIGLGYMLFVLPFLDFEGIRRALLAREKEVPVPQKMRMAPAMQFEKEK